MYGALLFMRVNELELITIRIWCITADTQQRKNNLYMLANWNENKLGPKHTRTNTN